MTNQSGNIEKKQRSLTEFIVVIVIIALMMKLLLEFLFSQQEKVTNAAFVGLSQNFMSKVNVVHGQWLMDDQPSVLVLKQMNGPEKQYFIVNDRGWIDSEHKSLACHKIWKQTLAMPLRVVKSPITAIEIKNKVIKNGRLCRYGIANGQYFDYRSDTGKVKQVHELRHE
jgi:hypothetical protein